MEFIVNTLVFVGKALLVLVVIIVILGIIGILVDKAKYMGLSDEEIEKKKQEELQKNEQKRMELIEKSKRDLDDLNTSIITSENNSPLTREDVIGDFGPTNGSTYTSKKQQTKQIIKENKDNRVACCPKCGSTSLSANKRGWKVTTGLIGSSKIIVTCLNCGNKFKPGK